MAVALWLSVVARTVAGTSGWRMAVLVVVETIGIANGWTSVDEGKWNDLQLGSEKFAKWLSVDEGNAIGFCRCFASLNIVGEFKKKMLDEMASFHTISRFDPSQISALHAHILFYFGLKLLMESNFWIFFLLLLIK